MREYVCTCDIYVLCVCVCLFNSVNHQYMHGETGEMYKTQVSIIMSKEPQHSSAIMAH